MTAVGWKERSVYRQPTVMQLSQIAVGLIVIWTALPIQASDPSLDAAWNAWKASYGKVYYSTEEESKRRAIWEEKDAYIKAHNALHAYGLQNYTLEHNRFSVWTAGEFKELGGSKPTARAPAPLAYQSSYGTAPANRTKLVRQELPPDIDWRNRGAVSPIRDQGDCRSCWAFAAAGAVESAYFLGSGQLIVRSVEQFIDCAEFGSPRPDRCADRSSPEAAFNWARMTRVGINRDEVYPLFSVQKNVPAESAPCLGIMENDPRAIVRDMIMLEQGSENALKEALANTGPVTVLIAQDSINQMQYRGGIFDDASCPNTPDDINHAVLAVGYATDSGGVDYWILKNSYGVEWGDQGYLYLKRGVNQCGVAISNFYPLMVQ